MNNQIEFYQSPNGQTQIEVKFENETVWLSQDQLVKLFQRDQSVISRHIRKIFKEGELDEKSNMQKMHITSSDKPVAFYNLEVIISVGYRVKSHQGTQFRQWATQRLKDFLVQGYAINEKRLSQKQLEVQTLRDGIRILSRAIEQKAEDHNLDWLNHFAKGLELLDDYDHENLDTKGLTKRQAIFPELKDYPEVIQAMKSDFESGVFGKEKDGSFESAVSQISKGYGEKDFYPTLEEKAATLLYLIVKNHAFVDGNKRIAAACFLLFLRSNDRLYNSEGISIISNDALASLTLFIASSKPDEMDTVKKLVISVLNRN